MTLNINKGADMNDKIVLRIKRKFFLEILSGTKVKEYRNYTDYYKALFSKNKKILKLHYQSGDYLEVNIKKINIIKNIYTKEERPPHLYTDYIFEVILGKITENTTLQ